jgi:hypothetical protein
MSTGERIFLKKEESNLEKEISSLKKVMSDYKAEGKVNWKEFKNKMNEDVSKLKNQLMD